MGAAHRKFGAQLTAEKLIAISGDQEIVVESFKTRKFIFIIAIQDAGDVGGIVSGFALVGGKVESEASRSGEPRCDAPDEAKGADEFIARKRRIVVIKFPPVVGRNVFERIVAAPVVAAAVRIGIVGSFDAFPATWPRIE